MSLDHEEETMFSDMIKAGEHPSLASIIAGIARSVAETMTPAPERWMRARINEARWLQGHCSDPAVRPKQEGGKG